MRQHRKTNDEWARADAEWRDPAQVVSQWPGANAIDPRLMKAKTRGDWWDIIKESRKTLLVTREYEHLVIAMRAGAKGPVISFLPLPHPSGLAIDKRRKVVHVASTRNPNQILDLIPIAGPEGTSAKVQKTLVPVRSRFLPGRLYLHDLAFVGSQLCATAVGENAIIRVLGDGRSERVWWPRAIETRRNPLFDQNYLQLNSIAAGPTLRKSFFTASAEKPLALRPGHQKFPVDKLGVIFSGATREPVVRGLTRPHSARIHRKRLWVDNSGYGELCVVNGSGFDVVTRLSGWTRGLCFHKGVAFVATSRVIPRFRQYAPGLDVDRSECGVHAVDIRTGELLGSIIWPGGNQIFAAELIDESFASDLPFAQTGSAAASARAQQLFYSFS
ncbi:MAG TPA: DUF4915 domain-containing protein [Pyrinomonadaceae bacterium]|nr:DUF4915 domain-containing protein [Pyrinomonadaceae bacterium]